MLKKALSKGVDQKTFNTLLHSAWKTSDSKVRLGIALSGGQDSMALAALCEGYRKAHPQVSFSAFIVDHDVRPESQAEAQRTRNIVRTKTGIDVEILKLKWTSHVHPLKLLDFESIARRLRYRALAQACSDHGITTLLLGHHADDQAETVLSRITANYVGSGLAGMQRNAPIPECDEIYGCHSGKPVKVPVTPVSGFSLEEQTVMIENGGIRIFRPLLDFTKADLKETCKVHGLRWAEDKTNADRTLGPRNAIRYLLGRNRLPVALSTRSLLDLATERRKAVDEATEAVERIFDDCNINLNPINGSVDVKYPHDIKEHLFSGSSATDKLADARSRAALLLRRIILLVSPLTTIRLADCRMPAEITFPFLFSTGPGYRIQHGSVATVAKAHYRITCPSFDSTGKSSPAAIQCQITRTPPTAQDKAAKSDTLIRDLPQRSDSFNWEDTPMKLFDGRYWIRLRYRLFNLTPGHRICIRFLEDADIDQIRTDKTNPTNWVRLKAVLKEKAPGKVRYMLPAIVQTHFVNGEGGRQELKSRLLALPTLDWSSAGWVKYDKKNFQEAWMWTVRYKKVEFEAVGRHGFVG
ncbi:hypothetical protein K461DRAFT_293960 [Myriangium duriaei CBS 260.36]|uniref:tRNA(Ile)-lysidine synthetase n=1 Tax=Myriangium duriaei CBS 260.36 TaxID=1168546 RepID=A0A9P4J4M1_9PEZI|nr:hypothetical protein K461DRAFT_293960 [Myriangium duriaei CBS 260.36]